MNSNQTSLKNEATEWIIRLNSGKINKRDKLKFSEWLMQSEQHKIAFDEQLSIYELTGALSPLSELEKKRTSLLQPWSLAIPFAAAAIVIVTLILFTSKSLSPLLHYESEIGQIREISLSDNSHMFLNTNTSASVTYDKTIRKVELHRGEAFFDVVSDPDKPFIVSTKRASFTAIGTAFSVYKKEQETELRVTQGTVAVTTNSTTKEARYIHAGEYARVSKSGVQVDQLSEKHLEIHWLNRHIKFDSTPMIEVINELNRYLSTPVSLTEEELGETLVTGGFNLAEPEATLSALLASFDLYINQHREIRKN